MKAPRTRKLIMLSSTIRTLIGGTDPSSSPAGKLGETIVGFFGLLLGGCGEAMRGVEGFEVCDARILVSIGAGGVGIGLFDVVERLVSEAEESWRCRLGGRLLVADEGMPLPRVVGEAVLCLGYCGRPLSRCGPFRVPPGDGRAGNCPVFNTAIECGAWGSCMRASGTPPPGEGCTIGMGGKYSVWVCVPSSWWW